MHAVIPLLKEVRFPALQRRGASVLQVNLGYKCNQSCLHCHVAASPQRTEMMDGETIDQIIRFIKKTGVHTLDLTGGAPELNLHFRRLVIAARQWGVRVIDRCNLTILFEPGQETLAAFLAEQGVEVTASLPCYSEDNVDRQRGVGVFELSIRGLRLLNSLGYGEGGLPLNLVYNPQGASLPPPQEPLEADYKRILWDEHGVRFSNLLTLANMPIQRFGSTLISKGQFQAYMKLLHSAHREENLKHVMCRDLVSVDWQGYVYDCDFNQMLGLPLKLNGFDRPHLAQLLEHDLAGNSIVVRDHCYGCTAGQGSSCGGALSQEQDEASPISSVG